MRVCRADHGGRPPLSPDYPAGDWLLAAAAALDLENHPPQPIVLGRHLIQLGKKPGAEFKPILDACFEAQLDGVFGDLEGGLAFLRELLARPQ